VNQAYQQFSGVTPTVSFETDTPNGGHAVAAGSIAPGIITLYCSGIGSTHYLTDIGSTAVAETLAGVHARATETFLLEGENLSGASRVNIAVSYYLPWTSQATSTGTDEAIVTTQFSLIRGVGVVAASGVATLPTSGSVPEQTRSSLGTVTDTLPAGQVITYELNVPVGTPFELHQNVAFGGRTGRGGGDGTAAFSATAAVYWHGISEVTVYGMPVSGYTLRNSEGIDFTGSFAPVPEPEHYAAFAGTALVAFGLWRRQSRRA
jgi:hypothetical protein